MDIFTFQIPILDGTHMIILDRMPTVLRKEDAIKIAKVILSLPEEKSEIPEN